MAHWQNPLTRKIGKYIFDLFVVGIEKQQAIRMADTVRNAGHKARVIPDTRLGRYDIKNHDVFYCVYKAE